jgi:hypothetical protein
MQSEVRNIEAKRVKGEGDPGSGVRCQGSGTRGQVPGVQGPLAKMRYPFRVLDGL